MQMFGDGTGLKLGFMAMVVNLIPPQIGKATRKTDIHHLLWLNTRTSFLLFITLSIH